MSETQGHQNVDNVYIIPLFVSDHANKNTIRKRTIEKRKSLIIHATVTGHGKICTKACIAKIITVTIKIALTS